MSGIVGKRSAAIVFFFLLIAGTVSAEGPALRSRLDADRGRLWTLTLQGVELYDAATRRKVAQIALPGWIVVRDQYACAPDLAIGPRGEAVISSNVVSTLWRVDPVTLAVSAHELALEEEKGRDIGFTALQYSAQQAAFLAVGTGRGQMWRIDPQLRRAQDTGAAPDQRCGDFR